ncbi:MAG: hypothetical protein IPO21_12460, partial [Bacteroidales bacterium]|nr:hypothetical protein [Bacteroidales bacterium]
MKSKLPIFILLLILSFGAMSQNYQWVNYLTSSARVAPYILRTDGVGNVYLLSANAGNVVDTVNAQNGEFIQYNHGKTDFHVAKFDPSGNLLWTRQIGSVSSIEQIYNMLVKADGTVFVLGGIYSTCYIDNGINPLTNSLTATGDEDAFIARYDTDGTLEMYDKIIYGLGRDRIASSCFNEDTTSILTTGFVRDNNATLKGNATVLTTTVGSQVGFFARFDFNGNCQSIQQYFTCSLNLSTPTDILCADNENVYIYGTYAKNLTFTDSLANTDNITFVANTDLFILKANQNGVISWLESASGAGTESSVAMVYDNDKNVYLSGNFGANLTVTGLDGSANIVLPYGASTQFLIKYNSDGSVIWAKSGMASESGILTKMIYISGQIYSIGRISGTNRIFYKDTVSTTGSNDVVLSIMDTSANFIGATKFGGTLSDYGLCLNYSNLLDGIYSTGIFVSPKITIESSTIFNYSAAKDNSYIAKHCPPVRFAGLKDLYCPSSTASILTGIPAGGTFSGSGISGNTFDPSTLSEGTYTITYTHSGVPAGCNDSYTIKTYVDSLPTIGALDPTYCLNAATATLSAIPAGGTFTVDGISRTEFSPIIEGVGVKEIAYNYTDVTTGCNSTATRSVTVIDTTDIVMLTFANVCVNDPTFTLEEKATPLNGTYSGTGVNANMFSPGLAGVNASPGHTITYTFTDANMCTSVAHTKQIVNNFTPVTFNILPETCENSDATDLTTFVSALGGIFQGSGVSGNKFYPSVSGANLAPFLIDYIYTDANGCKDTSSQNILVNSIPTVTLSVDDKPLNYGSSTTLRATPAGGSGSGYTFLWSPADSLIDAATSQNPNTILLSRSTNFENIVTDDNNCSSEPEIVMVQVIGGPLSAIGFGTSVCPNATGNISVIPSGGS